MVVGILLEKKAHSLKQSWKIVDVFFENVHNNNDKPGNRQRILRVKPKTLEIFEDFVSFIFNFSVFSFVFPLFFLSFSFSCFSFVPCFFFYLFLFCLFFLFWFVLLIVFPLFLLFFSFFFSFSYFFSRRSRRQTGRTSSRSY